MDTNLSMVPPPACHQNIPHQPLNIEGFGVGISCFFFFFLLVVGVWLSYFRSITRGVRKQQSGGKNNPPRHVLHGTSRYRAACPASQSFGNATQPGKLQIPWSGLLQTGRIDSTNALLQTSHLCRLSIQTAQSSSKLLAAAATLLSNQEAEET